MTSTGFQPSFSLIAAISQGFTTTITFTENAVFTPGQVVSFRVSPPSGMRELNNQQAVVQSATSNSITVAIDSTNYTPFIFEPENELTFPAMVVPRGSGIIPASVPPTINLQDAFDNIPPN